MNTKEIKIPTTRALCEPNTVLRERILRYVARAKSVKFNKPYKFAYQSTLFSCNEVKISSDYPKTVGLVCERIIDKSGKLDPIGFILDMEWLPRSSLIKLINEINTNS